eukprot:s588_g1.t1
MGQDMVASRPEDPVDFMIKRLEAVCKDSQGTDYDLVDGETAGTILPAEEPKPKQDAAADTDEDDIDSGGDDEGPDLPPPPPVQRKQRQSVSAEAYGAFNERKAYEPKDQSQKDRLEKVLQQCWMFKHHTPENLKIILDAMQEKVVESGTRLIQQGDEGEVMWVIEEGELECFKKIGDEDRFLLPRGSIEKSVKKCSRGDVFGELALLYNCRRAASVVASQKSVLWELDRETFKAICYEAAQKAPPEYEGFSVPGGAASSAAPAAAAAEAPKEPEPPKEERAASKEDALECLGEDGADSDSDPGDTAESVPIQQVKRPVGRRTGVSAEATKGGEDRPDSWTPPVYEKTAEERASLSEIIKSSRDSKIHMLFGTVNQKTFETRLH